MGTAVYNGSLKLPGLSYDEDYVALEGADATPGMRAPPSMASSALMKSPLLRRMSQEYESPAGALTLAARAAARRANDATLAAGASSINNRPRAASSTERQGLVPGKGGGVAVEDLEYGTR